LTTEQQRAIANALRRFSGHAVEIRSYSLDLEGWRLAQLIKAALEAGGLRVTDETANLISMGGFTVGIQIAGPSAEGDLIVALMGTLMSDGKLTISTQKPGPMMVNEAIVTVLVGVKPFTALKAN
jgi:hypothetical protein